MQIALFRSFAVRSRAGNWCLLVTGALIAIAAIALLVYSIAKNWGYAGSVDHLIRAVLLVELFISTLIVSSAWERLHTAGGPAPSQETAEQHG